MPGAPIGLALLGRLARGEIVERAQVVEALGDASIWMHGYKHVEPYPA